MVRESGRCRVVKNYATGGTKAAVIPKLGPRKTRSQSLKENQEIEIQLQVPVDEEKTYFRSDFADIKRNSRSLSRASSEDSALSSCSSKWSLSSNVSIVSRKSQGITTRKLTQTLDPVAEDRIPKSKVDINPDTINWVNGLSPTRIQAAVPLLRTRAVANGHLTKRTLSYVTESSNSDSGYNSKVLDENYSANTFRSEAVIHFHICVLWALMLSAEHHLKLSSKNVGKQSMGAHPVALQVAAAFILGTLCDLISPKLALLVPQTIWVLVVLLVHITSSNVAVQLVPYLPCINSGLLGCQFLAIHLGFRGSHAGVLSRVNLSYCLASIVVPFIITMMSSVLGSSINSQLVTLVSLLSMMAVLRLLGSNLKGFTRLPLLVPDNCSPARFLSCIVMKVALTVPASLLLPWLQSLLNDGGSINGIGLPILVTVGLLLAQAALVPSLLVCTKSSTATGAMAALLMLLYPVMVLSDESSSILLVLLIPVCGLVAVAQNLVVADLVSTFPQFPGVILALNLSLHILIRYFTPRFSTSMIELCADKGRTHLISLSFPQWLRYLLANNFISDISPLLPTSLDFLSCHKVHINVITVMGCACSFVLLILARST
ncbi:uncharacterized protein [Procambarus clarkii]|uniref:uncharacterized protein n=1 Tax=Procambarus clarkii TaxID=6728 RepID=UPI0037427967